MAELHHDELQGIRLSDEELEAAAGGKLRTDGKIRCDFCGFDGFQNKDRWWDHMLFNHPEKTTAEYAAGYDYECIHCGRKLNVNAEGTDFALRHLYWHHGQ